MTNNTSSSILSTAKEYIARDNMVFSQLYTNEIIEPRLLEALKSTPRELFVPESLKGAAYVDDELRITPDRSMLSPLLFAKLVKHANIQPSAHILDVACATGYSTAVLSQLGRVVTGIDTDTALISQANNHLNTLNRPNASTHHISLLPSGYADNAPYDVIFINGAIQSHITILLSQLKTGGRLVTMEPQQENIPTAQGLCTIVTYLQLGDTIQKIAHNTCSAPVLPEFRTTKPFIF